MHTDTCTDMYTSVTCVNTVYDDANSCKIKNPCLSKIVFVCPRGIVKHSLVQWPVLKATRASLWKRWPPPTIAQPLEYVT